MYTVYKKLALDHRSHSQKRQGNNTFIPIASSNFHWRDCNPNSFSLSFGKQGSVFVLFFQKHYLAIFVMVLLVLTFVNNRYPFCCGWMFSTRKGKGISHCELYLHSACFLSTIPSKAWTTKNNGKASISTCIMKLNSFALRLPATVTATWEVYFLWISAWCVQQREQIPPVSFRGQIMMLKLGKAW